MKKISFGVVLVALSCTLPVWAQGGGGARAVLPPVRRAPTTTILKAPPVVQTGLNGNAAPSRECTPCDKGPGSPTSGYYNPYGFPQYPGPNAPLPPQGTYYANPYDYYDNYNPNNPYGYYQNGGFYNPGYYNSGYYSSGYSSGSPAYSPGASGPSTSSGSSSFPAFQGYNTGGRR